MTRGLFGGVTMAACIALHTPVALGQAAETSAAHFEYRAAADCPPREELLRQVRARTQRARVAVTSESARVFAVEIAGDGAGARGRLVVRELDAFESAREVSGKDCSEVVAALALVIALVIDPNASTEPLAKAASPPPEPPETPPAAADSPPPLAAAAQERRSAWRWGVEATLGVTGGVAPDPSPELGLFASLRDQGSGAWAPLLALGAVAAQSFEVEAADGAARFTRWAARLALCPLRVPDDGQVAARPCVFAEGGVLSGEGIDVPNADTASALWLAAGAMLRADVLLSDVAVLGLQVSASFPAFRDRFYVDPGPTWEHRVPDLTGAAALVLGFVGP